MRIVTLLIVAVAFALAAGCSDRHATYFATYTDAQNADALGPGKWLPTFLPVSATAIREEHDIDTNALWVSFTLGGDFDAPPSCSPSVGDVALCDRAPGWWRQAAKAMDSPTQLYQCENAVELGGYWARSKCFLWTSPRTALYRCLPATLEPKAKTAAAAQDRSPAAIDPDVDKAVIGVVLEDFANWKEATFGELEGVLELKPDSLANPDGTTQGVKALASEIADRLDDEAVVSFVERNRSAMPVASLFAGSRWARLRPPTATDAYSLGPPDGAKAVGYLTLPGYSADGSRALLQIRHSWSMHGAVVTYVLSRDHGHWKVVARDQAVFL